MGFFIEATIGGLMSGMLYALVALGFVLIFKASGVFNFAQGAMVLFAALAMARFAEWIPQLLGLTEQGAGQRAGLHRRDGRDDRRAWLIERLVLGKLVNQEGITLLMATLGITYFLDGFGQTIFGSDIYKIDVGMPKDPIFLFEKVFQGGILVSQEDLVRRGASPRRWWRRWSLLPVHSTGRALRAVADDHQAAQSVGIPLKRIWVIVWSVAGFVALVAGMIWGSKLGVQFSLSLVALKALPVVILGGLTVGAGRHRRRPDHRRRREALRGLHRPDASAAASRSGSPMCWPCCSCSCGRKGLFGEKIIDRVSRFRGGRWPA
jgi:branched-chain amino acid transport system permease protein